MKLQYVKLKNFKSYPDQETKIDLSFDGIKLLVGENGSGKSTFFDAIIWGIYGKNKDGADGVVNRKTKKNCKVEVGFRVGSNDYSIVRYRKHDTNGNKVLFFKGKKNISQRTAGATQELIDEVIEIQYNTMISSVVLSSELYTSFLRSSRSERLKTFESILSLKEITLFYNKLKKLKDPVDEKVKKISSDVDKTFVAIKSLSDNIDEYKDGVKKTLLELKVEKEKLQDEVFKLTEKITEYDVIDIDVEIENNSNYDIIKKRNDELRKIIKEENKQIVFIDGLVADMEEIQTEIDENKKIDVQKEISFLDEISKIETSNNKIESGIDKLSVLEVDTYQLKKAIKIKQEEKKTLIKEINNIKEHLDVCPTCGQKVEAQLTKNLIDDKEDLLRKIELKLKEDIEILEKAENKNKEIEEAISKLKNKIKEVPSSNYKRDFLISIKDDIKNLEHKLSLILKDIESGEDKNKGINERVEKLNSELNNNNKALKEPEYHTVFLKDLKEKIVLMKDEAEEKRLDIEKIDVKAKSSYDKGYIDNTQETIKKLKKKLTREDKKLGEAEKDQKHYEALLTVFSNKDSGFKKFFINKMISVFNDRVNFYLPFFFDEDMKIEFDKDLNEVIKLENEEVTFASFSSGQKTRFDIAISFSLFMMVKMFFSSTINLLVFDEILDMNLDKKGFNSVHDIIENLGEYNTVFVVSHQEFYKEKFSHHIHIKRKDGFSYIYQEV